jgi:tight adherence protein B
LLAAVGVLGFVTFGWLGALGGVGAATLVPRLAARRRTHRAARALGAQLADGVSVISEGLRAGRSLLQAVELAAETSPAPLGPSLRGVAERTRLGEPLASSLRRWAEAARDPDVELVVSALTLHGRTGGDLPRVLEQLAGTLRARVSIACEVSSLTAQARMSGAILGFLPIGFFAFLSVASPRDMALAYHSSLGRTAIALGLTLQGGAFLWIRSLLRVEA